MKERILAFLLILMLGTGLVTAAFPREKAEAAIAFIYDKKKPGVMLTEAKGKEIFVGGKSVSLGYVIGGKKTGVKGRWKSSNPSVVKVSKKGKVTAVGNGTAIVSFTFKGKKKEISIKSKLVAKTRATSISLMPSYGFDGTVVFGGINSFEATMTTNPKALKINSKVKHSYKTYFELFMDSELKNPAPPSFATVRDTGIFTAGNETGTVYLRAVGKLSKNSKTGVIYSNPIAITIGPKLDLKEAEIRQTALNQFEIHFEQADKITGVEIWDINANTEIRNSMILSEDGKSLKVTADNNLTKIAKLILKAGDKSEEKLFVFSDQKVADIILNGDEAALVKFENNKGRAEINLKLLDQFGTDVTSDPRFNKQRYAIWENRKAEISEDGRISFDLTPEQSEVGYRGTLKVSYVGEEPSIDREFEVKIGNFRVAKEIKVEGVFRKLSTGGYAKVLDRDGTISVGTVIGKHTLTSFLDSYAPFYLLIKVKDNLGNTMAEANADSKKYEVSILSNTGLELDYLMRKEVVSLEPVVIGGERFLAYPIKSANLREGDIIIKASIPGTKITDFFAGKVSKTVGSGILTIAGEGFVDEDNLINFSLYDSANNKITKYEEVISVLGLNESAPGDAFIPLDSTIIRSANSSTFRFKKNLQNGEAGLYYRPYKTSLPPDTKKFIEEITVFVGSANEKVFILTVKSR